MVARLILTHVSSRYSHDVSDLDREARAVFPNTQIARDGMEVEVPYADGPALEASTPTTRATLGSAPDGSSA